MVEYANRIRQFRPVLLTSYPTPLERFAEFCREENLSFDGLKAIVCSAETLHPAQRQTIEGSFGVPVFNSYGSREFSDIAQECAAHNGLHVCIDRLFLEVLRDDGRPCVPGEVGELVITDLDNYVMPFIRYRTGDLGSLSPLPCPCGRGLPLLESIEGRVFDLIDLPSGGTISGTFWTLLTRHASRDIVKFQVVQERVNEICLDLVVKGGSLRSEEEALLRARIAEKAPGLRVLIKYATDIPVTAAGKHRFVINKLRCAKTFSDRTNEGRVCSTRWR